MKSYSARFLFQEEGIRLASERVASRPGGLDDWRRPRHRRGLDAAGLGRPSQVFCGEADRHAAFADSGGDHLGRPGANISHREDTGPTCLNQERASVQLVPPVEIARARCERRASEHEPLIVEGYLATEPLG